VQIAVRAAHTHTHTCLKRKLHKLKKTPIYLKEPNIPQQSAVLSPLYTALFTVKSFMHDREALYHVQIAVRNRPMYTLKSPV